MHPGTQPQVRRRRARAARRATSPRRGVLLGDDLAAMTLVASLIEQAERFLPQLVLDARANGHTWHEIAHALDTSPDNA